VYPYLSNASKLKSSEVTEQPKHLNQCKAWDLNGAVVMRYFPQFAVTVGD
jgi:hypothetical protein